MFRGDIKPIFIEIFMMINCHCHKVVICLLCLPRSFGSWGLGMALLVVTFMAQEAGVLQEGG